MALWNRRPTTPLVKREGATLTVDQRDDASRAQAQALQSALQRALDLNPYKSGNEVAVLEPPAPPAEPVIAPRPAKVRPTSMVVDIDEAHLKEYSEIAASIGLNSPDMLIEEVKFFLKKNDIPVFALTEVVKYMDELAANESKAKSGWEWRPVREKDRRSDMGFGTAASRSQGFDGTSHIHSIPASDYYAPKYRQVPYHSGQQQEAYSFGTGAGVAMHYETVTTLPDTYDKLIPMRALRKVALIDKHFGDRVAMFVTDYALAPHIKTPDPFLMVAVANKGIKDGIGRFVIDFWDEPGFGLAQQLAPGV